ncbi:hypothetical protein C3L33_21459, partial [Rhododendron williamsianum]
IFTAPTMGLDETVAELGNGDRTHQARAICLHAYYDLSRVSPVVFLYLLKECYAYGTLKATKKFQALQQQVHQVLYNSPQPGPAVFVAHSLYVLPIFEADSEGFSHLIISALRRFLKVGTSSEDLLEAKSLAAQLFLLSVGGYIVHDEKVLVKMVKAFDISLENIGNGMCNEDQNSNSSSETARTFVEKFIFKLIEAESYMAAVTLLEHFSIHQSGESFLLKMMQNKDYRAADKWATFMGKAMLCVLVQEYSEKKLLKHAYDIIKSNNLQQEFPEIYHKCKESSLKKLAEKGCWDIAEAKTNGDKQLLEYLVYLAMEAGYFEKVDEYCDRYSLNGFINVKEPETSLLGSRYLQLNELVLEDIIWVDEVNGLRDATCQLRNPRLRELTVNGSLTTKREVSQTRFLGLDIASLSVLQVSIMQIASENVVFIFDLIKLFEDVPDILDNCLGRILQSPRVLKLGYNFQCDVRQLAESYGGLECFKQYEMLLDVQNVFREHQGGLSGLAKKILGAGLNKTRRNSNWEQRPLSQNQLEYAAMDAAVLIHIFRHVRSYSQPDTVAEGHTKIEWKSYIVSHMDNSVKTKKVKKSKKKSDAGSDVH